MFKSILNLFVVVCFFLTSLGPLPKAHAATDLGLPAPGNMVNLSPAYQPVMIKGLTVHKDDPFLFDFIVDVGQDRMAGQPLKKEGEKLIKYFLASLAIPDKDVWVNLSPYEKDRIIPDALGQTDMGRDLLEQDYILKQITASLIYPEKQLGKSFWNRVYAEAQEKFGTTQIPVNTFNKVWIMADRAEVFEHNQTAFVTDSHLKVMLEEDYLALNRHSENTSHSITPSIIRQIILPELEKEVNTGKNFANLRQIFNSIILAGWYKRNLKQALLNQVYSNKNRVGGVAVSAAMLDRHEIYDQYLKAYKKGVFNYIKNDINAANGRTMPRKYFSGGIAVGQASAAMITENPFKALQIANSSSAMVVFAADFISSNAAMNSALYDMMSSAANWTLTKLAQAEIAQPGSLNAQFVMNTVWSSFNGRDLGRKITRQDATQILYRFFTQPASGDLVQRKMDFIRSAGGPRKEVNAGFTQADFDHFSNPPDNTPVEERGVLQGKDAFYALSQAIDIPIVSGDEIGQWYGKDAQFIVFGGSQGKNLKALVLVPHSGLYYVAPPDHILPLTDKFEALLVTTDGRPFGAMVDGKPVKFPDKVALYEDNIGKEHLVISDKVRSSPGISNSAMISSFTNVKLGKLVAEKGLQYLTYVKVGGHRVDFSDPAWKESMSEPGAEIEYQYFNLTGDPLKDADTVNVAINESLLQGRLNDAIRLFTLNRHLFVKEKERLGWEISAALIKSYKGYFRLVGKMGGTEIQWALATPAGLVTPIVSERTHLYDGKRPEVDELAQDARNSLSNIMERIVGPMKRLAELDGVGYGRIRDYYYAAPGYFGPNGELVRDQKNIADMQKGFVFDDAIPEALREATKGKFNIKGKTVHDGTGHAWGDKSIYGPFSLDDTIYGFWVGTGIASRVSRSGFDSFTGDAELHYVHNEGPHQVFWNPSTGRYDIAFDELKGLDPEPGTKYYGRADLESRTKGAALQNAFLSEYESFLAKSPDNEEILEVQRIMAGKKFDYQGLKFLETQKPALLVRVYQARAHELGLGIGALLWYLVDHHWQNGETFDLKTIKIPLGGMIAQINFLGFFDKVKEGILDELKYRKVPEDVLGLVSQHIMMSPIDEDLRELLGGLPSKEFEMAGQAMISVTLIDHHGVVSRDLAERVFNILVRIEKTGQNSLEDREIMRLAKFLREDVQTYHRLTGFHNSSTEFNAIRNSLAGKSIEGVEFVTDDLGVPESVFNILQASFDYQGKLRDPLRGGNYKLSSLFTSTKMLMIDGLVKMVDNLLFRIASEEISSVLKRSDLDGEVEEINNLAADILGPENLINFKLNLEAAIGHVYNHPETRVLEESKIEVFLRYNAAMTVDSDFIKDLGLSVNEFPVQMHWGALIRRGVEKYKGLTGGEGKKVIDQLAIAGKSLPEAVAIIKKYMKIGGSVTFSDPDGAGFDFSFPQGIKAMHIFTYWADKDSKMSDCWVVIVPDDTVRIGRPSSLPKRNWPLLMSILSLRNQDGEWLDQWRALIEDYQERLAGKTPQEQNAILNELLAVAKEGGLQSLGIDINKIGIDEGYFTLAGTLPLNEALKIERAGDEDIAWVERANEELNAHVRSSGEILKEAMTMFPRKALLISPGEIPLTEALQQEGAQEADIEWVRSMNEEYLRLTGLQYQYELTIKHQTRLRENPPVKKEKGEDPVERFDPGLLKRTEKELQEAKAAMAQMIAAVTSRFSQKEIRVVAAEFQTKIPIFLATSNASEQNAAMGSILSMKGKASLEFTRSGKFRLLPGQKDDKVIELNGEIFISEDGSRATFKLDDTIMSRSKEIPVSKGLKLVFLPSVKALPHYKIEERVREPKASEIFLDMTIDEKHKVTVNMNNGMSRQWRIIQDEAMVISVTHDGPLLTVRVDGSEKKFNVHVIDVNKRIEEFLKGLHINAKAQGKFEIDFPELELSVSIFDAETFQECLERINVLHPALEERIEADTHKADHAAISAPGGIDLGTSNAMIKVSRDGQGVEMNVDAAMIERFRHEGVGDLSPFIISVTPLASIWPLVGLKAPSHPVQLAKT